MATKDSRTKAFSTTAKPKNNKKSIKSRRRLRHQIVISIFTVIALILIVFATLIIGKIITVKKNDTPDSNPEQNYAHSVSKDEAEIHKGNLILIDKNHPFDYSINNLIATSYDNLPNGIVNLWTFKNTASNTSETKIHIDSLEIDAPTYELASPSLANQIALEENTLHAFNQMLLDYCHTLDLSNYTSGSASKINVAWGWSHQSGLMEDIDDYGESFYTQADGRSITLMKVKSDLTSERVTETILKNDFAWIYNNAHKYGFIIRYPDGCKDHTGFNSTTRIHLRYIGTEHATYIHNNGCCLEEYLKTLREQHGYNNPLEFTANGKTYNVYYVAYSGNPTNIPVPEDKNHYISGDNMNGYIVTVEK